MRLYGDLTMISSDVRKFANSCSEHHKVLYILQKDDNIISGWIKLCLQMHTCDICVVCSVIYKLEI